MRILTASLMAVVICLLVVLPPANSYAFSYEIHHFPFKLAETEELRSSIREIFERYEHSNFDTNNSDFSVVLF